MHHFQQLMQHRMNNHSSSDISISLHHNSRTCSFEYHFFHQQPQTKDMPLPGRTQKNKREHSEQWQLFCGLPLFKRVHMISCKIPFGGNRTKTKILLNVETGPSTSNTNVSISTTCFFVLTIAEKEKQLVSLYVTFRDSNI